MLQIISCENCGKDMIGFGLVYIDIILTRSKWCDNCGQSKTEKQTHFFCSEKCFQGYDKSKLIWEN
jgi:hypothetical protein